MPGALNVFKNVTANVADTMTTVYSTPVGYATVVLMAQMTNIDPGNTIQVSANIANGAVSTALIAGARDYYFVIFFGSLKKNERK